MRSTVSVRNFCELPQEFVHLRPVLIGATAVRSVVATAALVVVAMVVVVTARSLRVPRPGCLARVEREVEHPNVRVNDRGDVLGGLVDELDPEAAVARAGEPIYVRGARLRLRVEDGVAAAHVGEHEVVLAVAAAARRVG